MLWTKSIQLKYNQRSKKNKEKTRGFKTDNNSAVFEHFSSPQQPTFPFSFLTVNSFPDDAPLWRTAGTGVVDFNPFATDCPKRSLECDAYSKYSSVKTQCCLFIF